MERAFGSRSKAVAGQAGHARSLRGRKKVP